MDPSGASSEPVSAFGDVVEVRVVNLEAVVTDAEGRRMPGLQRGDFRLLVELKSLKEEVARLGPEDRMAIVAYDGKHLR